MEKKIQIAFALASAAIALLILLNFAISPMDAKREWLQAELSRVPDSGRTLDMGFGAATSYSGLIAERAPVWGTLVSPPERVAPPKKIEKPNMEKMLTGVEVTRFKVGDRIKIITKTNPDGGFFGIGDNVQGCILSDFTRSDATFTHYWKDGDETLVHRLPRQ